MKKDKAPRVILNFLTWWTHPCLVSSICPFSLIAVTCSVVSCLSPSLSPMFCCISVLGTHSKHSVNIYWMNGINLCSFPLFLSSTWFVFPQCLHLLDTDDFLPTRRVWGSMPLPNTHIIFFLTRFFLTVTVYSHVYLLHQVMSISRAKIGFHCHCHIQSLV